ncbi:MAG: serine/threonine protein kinase [Planctomycetes bacterium]|nr:serine/threonine protein kinase [Planctomycetota bacterium]
MASPRGSPPVTDRDAVTLRSSAPVAPDATALLAEYLLQAEIGPPPVLADYLALLPSPAAREHFVDLVDAAGFVARHLPLRLRPQLLLAGRYELIEAIGSGGMGQVWRAHDRKLDCEVAVKVLNVAAAAAVDLDRLVAREGRLLARLSHPGAVRVLDTGHDEEHRFVVMELVVGMSLDAVIDRLRERRRVSGRALRGSDVLGLVGPAGPGRTAVVAAGESWSRVAAMVVAELLRTLEAVHGVGVVHRDLKPGNVRLTGGGAPVVLDFGIGLHADRAPGTRTSELFGTAQYAAPEQWAGAAGVGAHTDVYQAGLVLYELLTLQRCFASTSPIETLRAVRDARYRRPRELDRGIDARLEACVLRALEVEPARRYASAAAFRADLEAFLAGQVPVAARAQARWSWQVRAFARRNRHQLALAGALLVGIAATALWRPPSGLDVEWVAAGAGQGLQLRLTVPENTRVSGFVRGRDRHGEMRCAPLAFGDQGDQLVLDLPAGQSEVPIRTIGDAGQLDDVEVSLCRPEGDGAEAKEFDLMLEGMQRNRRTIEQRDGEPLLEAEFRAQFGSGRGAAALAAPVESMFRAGTWSASGLQGRVVARPKP